MRSFTLMELLVVMGIIGVLGAITAVAYRAVAKDTKMSSAKNTVMAVLDNARGLAMRNNELVLVAFRPRIDGRKQYVEAVLAKWSRQSIPYNAVGVTTTQTIDRYIPIPGIAARRLPQGIHVAGPMYFDSAGGGDNDWEALSFLPNINGSGMGEVPSSILAVLFSPDGRNIMYNAKSDAQRIWVDFDNDGGQRWFGTNVPYALTPPIPSATHNGVRDHYFDKDEPCVSPMPYLAVYDDEAVRELYDVNQWNMLIVGAVPAIANRRADYSEYIRNNADRIHFNRYTGVALK